MNTDEKIVKILTALQTDIKVIHKDIKTIKTDIRGLNEKIETLDQKVEIYHKENQKDHLELLNKIFESNELTGQRIKNIEEHLGLGRSKN